MYITQLLWQKMRTKQKTQKAKEVHDLANVTYVHTQSEKLYFLHRKQTEELQNLQ